MQKVWDKFSLKKKIFLRKGEGWEKNEAVQNVPVAAEIKWDLCLFIYSVLQRFYCLFLVEIVGFVALRLQKAPNF